MILKYFLPPFFCVVMIGCTSTSYTAKKFNKYRVRTMVYIKPCISVGLVKEANKDIYNDSLTKISQDVVDSVLSRKKQKYNLTEQIFINNSYPDSIEQRIIKLSYSFAISHKRDTIKIDECLHHLIQKSSGNYVLMLVVKGFKRTDDNYSKKMLKTIGIAALTLGKYTTVWYKANSILYMMVADKNANKIIYFDQLEGGDPTNIKDMEGQISLLISSFRE